MDFSLRLARGLGSTVLNQRPHARHPNSQCSARVAGLPSLRTSKKAGVRVAAPLRRQAVVVHTAAVPLVGISCPPQVGQLSDDERKALAEKFGFRSIGKELPDSVTLQDVIKSMPPEVGRRGVCPEFADSARHELPAPPANTLTLYR